MQYENDSVVWKRDLEYTYGIEPLEKISYILLDLVKNDSDIFIEKESEENNMIKYDKGLVKISGKGIDILSEYAVITHEIKEMFMKFLKMSLTVENLKMKKN